MKNILIIVVLLSQTVLNINCYGKLSDKQLEEITSDINKDMVTTKTTSFPISNLFLNIKF
ncbi:hypothetical protein BW723_15345 [Polaribacter reichenbachii]|uniref:Uncharacterized protein n=1 Tax=Polaribacter reichenbachii TaxID=996801 RepID=A0A1B8U5E5_9FLAO|nr:hypothetical protein [Polaribacter reichenbachii]APZ47574.1 hypothetical protein BW723_15345 [Polaribacter reichenbachii]AUC18214.1 hypothetical protein BTO17_05790 [Polaribacter reichenbachii]OBY67073.1 hypothetical protein LPB301_04445 [Polaribacter reichenbachii]